MTRELLRRAEALNANVAGGIAARLVAVREQLRGPIVLTTAFGIESQLLTHFIARERLDIDLVTLDTGRLFGETLEVWAETEARYGLRVRALSPESGQLDDLLAGDGPMGFRHSVAARQRCCHVRKVAPLTQALTGAAGWISGLRRGQSPGRRDVRFAAADPARGLVKVSPLFDWSEEEVALHIRSLGIPYNRLLDAGFRSVGCQPCTRATRIGETAREGRWWWEDSTRECGLHSGTAVAA